MLVLGIPLDLNWFLQFIFTAFVIVSGLSYLVKNTASKYFEVDANFEGSDRNSIPGVRFDDAVCVVCGNSGIKICSRCKAVKYCSQTCQAEHWKSGHKTKCKDFQLFGKENTTQTATTNCGYKTSSVGGKSSSVVALVPAHGTSQLIKQSKKILFPYDDFVKLFNWDKPGFPPCGLLNCGNSCFANVVLQCLAYTRPLVAYLLEKGHRRECRRNDWCFLCEFQTHVERAGQNPHPFSPINILSRLPNIGGNLGYGRQEDAHEFMRFAIDTMQSVCLDEFGGEKAVHPSSQETTLIQHIFGGHLQSQVICTKCSKISNQYENMMDLTVEIHGDAASLEECLDQFTVKEWLHGENMYKCDGCNDYVKAWKRLTVRRAPNILTIALKRFQSGRFGKLNKRVTFPETLDLSPYMSESGDGTDLYKLYAVVVHVDMLNASFFGHYICYTKDFRGNWYRIDDCKVTCVELEDVLSQGAYMLLYSRVCARPSCLRTLEPSRKEQQKVEVEVEVEVEEKPSLKSEDEWFTTTESTLPTNNSGSLPLDSSPLSNLSNFEKESCIGINSQTVRARFEDIDVVSFESSSSASKEEFSCENGTSFGINSVAVTEDPENKDGVNFESRKGGSSCEKDSSSAYNSEAVREDRDINMVDSQSCSSLSKVVSSCKKDSSVGIYSEAAREDSEDMGTANTEPSSSVAKDTKVYGNGHSDAYGSASPVEHAHKLVSGNFFSSSETPSAEFHNMKHQSPLCSYNVEDGMGAKRAEITNDS